jgi:A/G-specific adenine glycosylase
MVNAAQPIRRRARRTLTGDRFAPRLLSWYDRSRRELPWRASAEKPTVDPYAVLVSEFMLQQTQVATVVPYFSRFMADFPTVGDLAAAAQQEVLRRWQGLGYYARARNLQAAAKRVVEHFGGEVPQTVDELLTLPGVGRYTAGAIASIAFGTKAPIVDGNVARVLCRLDKIRKDPRNPETIKKLWRRAEELLPGERVGDFNSALMELGATVCTPKSPKCSECPVRHYCKAAAAGVQDLIPPPRVRGPVPDHRRWTFCLSYRGRWLIEQRPASGRWAGFWQFVTTEAADGAPDARRVKGLLQLRVRRVQKIGQIRHILTHRRYLFDVFVAHADGEKSIEINGSRRWVSLKQLDGYPLSRPQLKIAQMLEGISIEC